MLGYHLTVDLGLKLRLTLLLMFTRKCARCGTEKHLRQYPALGIVNTCLDCLIDQNEKIRESAGISPRIG